MENTLNRLRSELKAIEDELRELDGDPAYAVPERFAGQHDEMRAQTMLVLRHIEDARMRCGKVLQYADDGVSILDKKE